MSLANGAAVIRPMVKTDENDVLAMLDTTDYKHLHADWQMPTAWLGRPGVAVYVLDGVVRGYVAATLDPPPVAWVRVLGVKRHDPLPAVQALLAQAQAQLRETAATAICCLSVSDWVDETLPEIGFTIDRTLQTYVKEGLDVPIATKRSVAIRPIKKEDFPAVMAVERRAFPEPLWWHSEAQLRLGQRFSCCFDVAEVDGQIVGFQYSTGSQGKYVHLVRVAVDPAVQGRGVGAALLAQAFETYRALGVSSVSLNSPSDKVAAHHLYAKFGFRPVGRPYAVWRLDL